MVEKGDVFALRRKMGMVFQSFQLFSNRTVLDNVTAGPRHLLKIPRKQAEEELVLQTILPALGEDAVPMKLSLEYSDADMSTELLLQYGGRAYNPLEEGDELSLRIVKSVAEEWSHEYREQNYLRMKFRQKD